VTFKQMMMMIIHYTKLNLIKFTTFYRKDYCLQSTDAVGLHQLENIIGLENNPPSMRRITCQGFYIIASHPVYDNTTSLITI